MWSGASVVASVVDARLPDHDVADVPVVGCGASVAVQPAAGSAARPGSRSVQRNRATPGEGTSTGASPSRPAETRRSPSSPSAPHRPGEEARPLDRFRPPAVRDTSATCAIPDAPEQQHRITRRRVTNPAPNGMSLRCPPVHVPLCPRRTRPEPVKPDETTCHADLMSASGVGSLIQATVGSFGGRGRRCPNRAGLAA